MIIKKLIYFLTITLLCLGYTAKAQSIDDPYNQSEETGIILHEPSNITHSVEYDPVTGQYIFYSKIGDFYYRNPYTMTQEQYTDYIQRKGIKNYWIDRRESTMGNSNGTSLIPPIYIGGKVFDKIFGSNTIDIKLQGSADVTFGVKYQRRRDPSLTVAQQRTTNFDFNENIQLSASAKIGERINFKMSYNTKTQFSFENKFTLKYEGDEDDILQLLEAGNVSMPLRSTLITGTQSLFGFKTKLKFGKTTVTAIASYQESETQNIAVSGGALTQEFELEAIDYEENRHFFLSQYFRDNYEAALATLPIVTSDINITKIEVWVTNTSSNYENCRNIVAFTDLGEGKDEWIYNTDMVHSNIYSGKYYPDNTANTLVQNMDTTQIRNLNTVTSYLTGLGYTSGQDFEKIQKARKLSANEYTVNRKLGFITLNVTLNSNQTLAVAYQYTVIGQDGVFQVGEFSDQGIQEPNLLTAKMLKSTTINTKMPMWDLMMKNVYNIRAYQVAPTNFTMNILYLGNSNGVATGYFADAPDNIRENSLLNLMGMDRLNSLNNPIEGGDGMFDFVNGAATNGGTINAATGRIYFTVLEPFGGQIRNKIFKDYPALADKYAFDSLYTMTKVMAQQYTDKNKYRLEGRYTSSSGSEINLNALNVQQGSVRVTAGGIPLTENVDYTVDYTLGRVRILNEALLNSGTTINVSLENNTAMSTIRKTFLGARVEHEINPTFILGGTVLHLSERSYTTKVNYNDEPISNTIYGFDINYQTDSQWLTDILDKLPLYETKTKSRITVSGEFARFIQGINKESGQTGTSYIDDFEGAKSTIDMHQWNFWHLASTPQNQSNLFPEGASVGLDNGKNRAKLAWYTIDQSVFYDRYGNLLPSNIDNEELSDNRVRQVLLTEIYPNKDIQAGTSTNMSVLNLAYYPKDRGPYNYDTDNINEDGTFTNPEDRWGGIMRAIESSDFNSTNVEYIEFWMMDPYYDNSQDQTNIGKMYINLGDVSEDILRDGRKAYEHGLPTSSVVEYVDTTVWGRVPSLQALVDAFNTDPDSRIYQDVGYDGLGDSDERSFFANYLQTIQGKVNATVFEQINEDPSSDNYHYFRGSDFDNDPKYASILERYKKYNGNEGNSPSDTQYTEDYTTNNSTLPDQEDINKDNTLSESENYYQYVIELDPNKMQTSGQNFISDIREATVQVANGETRSVKWYQFRVPVREPSRVIGNIEGFSSIRFMRLFLKGFKDDIVLRFATFDLVRGEWRTYTNAIQAPGEYQPGDQTNHTVFEMSAVNVEENSGRYPVPYCIPPGIEQEVYTGATSTVRQNEQALQLTVKNLVDGDARGVYKTTEFDFRFYKRLKMFVHAESMYETNPVLDNEITAFLRFGSDLTDNYYEYEVPLKITPWGTSIVDEYGIWPESNNFEIEFDKVVNVKSNRNTAIANGNTEVKVNRLYSEKDGKNTIKVLGNPTISEVRSMMIGIRNPKVEGEVAQDKSIIVWVNELRMTDLNSSGGYAATGRVEAYLADLGRVAVAGSYKSAGYGSLETKITDNDMMANRYYNVSADIDLGKFMAPEKSGMSVPVHFDHNNTTITPEYNPLDPDVKLSRSLQDLDGQGKDSLNTLARDVTTQTNFNITNLRKNRVKSKKPHFWDVENLNASYAYTNQEQTTPDMEYNRQKSHRGGIGYSYSTSAKPWTPFADKKWASPSYMAIFKDFNLYYLPKSFSFNTEMYRQIHTQKMRNKSTGLILLKETVAKSWDWTRNYDFRYDLTKNLNFTYNASTQAYVYEPAGNPERDSDEWRAYMDTVRNDILNFGSISRFNQTVKANYNIPINKLPFFEWLTATATYTGNYHWTASSRYTQKRLGNTIENDNSIQLSASADMTKLYNKSEYLKNLMTTARNNEIGRTRGIEANPKRPDKKPEQENDTVTKKGKKSNDSNSLGKAIVDNTLRIICSVKRIQFTYNKTTGVGLPGYMNTPNVFGMNYAMAPGLGFVLGQNDNVLNNAINKGWLSTDSTFNQAYTERMNETYNYKVSLEPFADLKIEVMGNRSYAENFSEYFRADNMGVFQFYTPTDGGNYSISNLMAATSFVDGDKLFENLCSYRNEIAGRLAHNNQAWVNMGEPYVYDEVGNEIYPYGYGSTSQEVLTYAFLAAYSGQSASNVSLSLFKTVALPNWSVNFTGLTRIAALKKLFKTITITHSYRSTLSVSSWSNNVNYDANQQMAVFNGTNIRIPQYDISQLLINEQYAPLIGVTLALNNTLTPSVEYKKSRTITLGFSNNQITEVNGREIIIGCGYTFKDLGFSLTLLDGNGSKKVSNDLKLKLDIGFRRDITTLRSIDERHSQISAGQNKINVYLTGDYNLSQRLGMQVFFKYDLNNPFIANAYKTTNVFAGITARFSLSQ